MLHPNHPKTFSKVFFFVFSALKIGVVVLTCPPILPKSQGGGGWSNYAKLSYQREEAYYDRCVHVFNVSLSKWKSATMFPMRLAQTTIAFQRTGLTTGRTKRKGMCSHSRSMLSRANYVSSCGQAMQPARLVQS